MSYDWHNPYYNVVSALGLRRILNHNRLSATLVLLLLVSFVLTLSMATLVPVVHAASGNLLTNAGFEYGLIGWSSTGGTAVYSVDSTIQNSGCCSAKGVETDTGDLGRLYQDVTGMTSPGNEYQISGWIKTDNIVVGGAAIDFNYVQADGWTPADGYVLNVGTGTGTQDWTYFQGTVTLPPMPADAVALYFAFDFNAAAGTAWWDDVSLVCVSGTCPVTTSTSVSCSPNPVVSSTPTTCTVSATGGSSPTGVVIFTSSSNTGLFSPSNGQCTLSSGSCQVTYTDSTVDSPTITAFYLGDPSNAASSGATPLLVSSPPAIPAFPFSFAIPVVLAATALVYLAMRRRLLGGTHGPRITGQGWQRSS